MESCVDGVFVCVPRWVRNREGCKKIGYLLDARELLSTRRGANRGNQLGELLVNSSNLFSWHRLLKSSGNAVASLGGFGGGIHQLCTDTNGVLFTSSQHSHEVPSWRPVRRPSVVGPRRPQRPWSKRRSSLSTCKLLEVLVADKLLKIITATVLTTTGSQPKGFLT
jgi:hypothetical protein